jgi:hypothetical protein
MTPAVSHNPDMSHVRDRSAVRDALAHQSQHDQQLLRAVATEDRGRGICSTCGTDLGPRDIPAGQLSHGYCPPCEAQLLAEIDAWDSGEIVA